MEWLRQQHPDDFPEDLLLVGTSVVDDEQILSASLANTRRFVTKLKEILDEQRVPPKDITRQSQYLECLQVLNLLALLIVKKKEEEEQKAKRKEEREKK